MGEVWYRGQSSAVPPIKPGGAIHDFGDGVYFTNSEEVAKQYAKIRVSGGGGKEQVFKLDVERGELGRVLDLTRDARWNQFLKKPAVPGRPDLAPEKLIKLANENYGRLFETFLKDNNIRIQDYDAVIGPEFVRGGSQMCILSRNGQASALAGRIQGKLVLLEPVSPEIVPTPAIPVVPGWKLMQTNRSQGILGNQAGMAMLGQLLGLAIQYFGDIGIQRQIERTLPKFNAYIESNLARHQGVLVIIMLQEWEQPDFNGMRARRYLDMSVEAGPTQSVALRTWQRADKIRNAPAEGWRAYEQYLWIDPTR